MRTLPATTPSPSRRRLEAAMERQRAAEGKHGGDERSDADAIRRCHEADIAMSRATDQRRPSAAPLRSEAEVFRGFSDPAPSYGPTVDVGKLRACVLAPEHKAGTPNWEERAGIRTCSVPCSCGWTSLRSRTHGLALASHASHVRFCALVAGPAESKEVS